MNTPPPQPTEPGSGEPGPAGAAEGSTASRSTARRATRTAAVLVVAVISAAVAWHTVEGVRAGRLEWVRLAVVATGLLALPMAIASRGRSLTVAERAMFALLAAGFLTVSGLDIARATKTVTAIDVALAAAAGAICATALFAAARPAGAEPRAGRIVLRLGLVASAVGVALCGLEMVLRTVIPLRFYAVIPDDPASGYYLLPQQQGVLFLRAGFTGRYVHPEFSGVRVEINQLALRDGADETDPPAAGEMSVLALGDSFVFGCGVEQEETFHEQLEARASELTPRALRVYGGGVPGHSPYQLSVMANRLWPHTSPDVVVAGLYEGNDLADALLVDKQARRAAKRARKKRAAKRGNPPSPSAGRPKRSGKNESESRGKPAQGTRRASRNGSLQKRRRKHVELSLAGLANVVFSPTLWLGSSAVAQAIGLNLAESHGPTGDLFEQCLRTPRTLPVEEARATTLRHLALLRRGCRENGADLVILIIPAATQAEQERFDRLVDSVTEDGTRHDRTAFHEGLVGVLREQGYTVVDTLPRLEAETRAGRPCYHREGHWNAHGHRVAADLLVPVLARLLGKRAN